MAFIRAALIRADAMTSIRTFVRMALVAFMPTGALAAMVLIIKPLVITAGIGVVAPIGVAAIKIVPVLRMTFIPGIPLRSIPDVGSDDIGGRISVIGRPAILGAEKVLQDAVQEPVTFVIDPRRIGPDPWGGIDIRGRGRIDITLGRRRCRGGSGAR